MRVHELAYLLGMIAGKMTKWGACGVSETPFIAVATAVASAPHEATGVRLDALPLVPPAVLASLRRHCVCLSESTPADSGPKGASYDHVTT